MDIKTGEEKWKFKTGNQVYSSPLVSEGVIHFGSPDNHLYAVDIKTGEEKWKFKTGKANYLSPVVSEGVVYFGSDDEHLYALDRQTGEIKWKFKAENRVYSSPAISESVVYFCSGYHLYSVDIEIALELHKEYAKEEERQKLQKKQLEEEEKMRKLNKTALSAEEIVQALWNNGPADGIYNYSYETEVTHAEADYIEFDGLGCERLEEVDPDADGYDPEDTEKIKIDAENYIDSNFEGDFFDNVNANTLIKELGTDIISKDDIESAISSMLDDLCNLFCGFTVMGGEKLYPELGDNPWEHPKTIYLEVSAPDVLLEDLNPDWTEDEYYLVD